MALGRYRNLCIDAVDAGVSGDFWARALGLRVVEHDGESVRLDGPGPRHTVWINAVADPHIVKNRLHIDVNTESIDALVAAGGTVLDRESFPWTVLADPDGGELCAFVREAPIHHRLYELVLDCLEPAAQARWWRGLLGGSLGSEAGADGQEYWWLDGIDSAPFECVVFAAVPEEKTVRNRVHVDLEGRPEEVEAHGARLLRIEPDRRVLADPEGNEFCVYPPH